MSKFDFEVETHPVAQSVPDRTTPDQVKDVYSVSLPHQCDDWTVGYGDRDAVADDLRCFIDEAEAALARLSQVGTCDHDWEPTGQTGTHNGGTWKQLRCSRCDRTVTQIVDKSTAQDWYVKNYYGG